MNYQDFVGIFLPCAGRYSVSKTVSCVATQERGKNSKANVSRRAMCNAAFLSAWVGAMREKKVEI